MKEFNIFSCWLRVADFDIPESVVSFYLAFLNIHKIYIIINYSLEITVFTIV